MIDALFIWQCGEETMGRVEYSAYTWEVLIMPPPHTPFVDAEIYAYPVGRRVLFSRCDYHGKILDGRLRRVFVSHQGEEPWMKWPLRRDRLRRELEECERIIRNGCRED